MESLIYLVVFVILQMSPFHRHELCSIANFWTECFSIRWWTPWSAWSFLSLRAPALWCTGTACLLCTHYAETPQTKEIQFSGRALLHYSLHVCLKTNWPIRMYGNLCLMNRAHGVFKSPMIDTTGTKSTVDQPNGQIWTTCSAFLILCGCRCWIFRKFQTGFRNIRVRMDAHSFRPRSNFLFLTCCDANFQR